MRVIFSTARSASSVSTSLTTTGHVGRPERLRGGDPVEAGDELEALAVVADDNRDQHPLQLDRAGERLDVLGVECADVLGTWMWTSAMRRPVSYRPPDALLRFLDGL